MAAAGPFQLPPYKEFDMVEDAVVANRWADWLDGFQAMTKAMKIASTEDRRAMLLHYIGTDVRKLFKKLENTGDDNDYDSAVAALSKYFAPTMNRIYLMNHLQQTSQQPSESMDSFHMRVRERMEPLDLDSLNVGQIIELITLSQLVNHCQSRSLRTKALKDGSNLKDFLANSRAYERAEQQTKEID